MGESLDSGIKDIPNIKDMRNDIPNIKDMLIYEPHNMLISGVTNCGKTYFALDLLEKDYRNKFENVVIFCPTYFNNKTYERKWIYLDKKSIHN